MNILAPFSFFLGYTSYIVHVFKYRDRAALLVIEYFAKSLKVIQNDAVEYDVYKSLLQCSILLKLCLYIVSFLRYSASKNSVTLKRKSFKVIENDAVW